jgi:hypothetical protein
MKFVHIFQFNLTHEQSIDMQRMPWVSNGLFKFISPLLQVGHRGNRIFVIVYKNINNPALCYKCVPNLSPHKNKLGMRCPRFKPYFALSFMTATCRGLQWPLSQLLDVKKCTVFTSTPCKDIQILLRNW